MWRSLILSVLGVGVLVLWGCGGSDSATENVTSTVASAAVAGGTLFAESGCLNCHTYLGSGSSNLGAPDLSGEGAQGRGIAWQVAHLKNPSSKTPGSPMPPFAALGDENLTKIATFLEASK